MIISQQASDKFNDLINDSESNSDTEIIRKSNEILLKYPNTTYADFAKLVLAKYDVESKKYDLALNKLQQVAKKHHDKPIANVALLRIAQIQIQNDKPTEALHTINKIKNKKDQIAAMILEGDCYLKLKQEIRAQESYQHAEKLIKQQPNLAPYIQALNELTIGSLSKLVEDQPNNKDQNSDNKLPVVVLVGPANVGKSTLFNAFAKQKLALVADEAGVTRDRHYTTIDENDCKFILVDTGGFTKAETEYESLALEQTEMAINEADLIILVFDGKSGAMDQDLVKKIRTTNKKWLLAVTKCDHQVAIDNVNIYSHLINLGLYQGQPG